MDTLTLQPTKVTSSVSDIHVLPCGNAGGCLDICNASTAIKIVCRATSSDHPHSPTERVGGTGVYNEIVVCWRATNADACRVLDVCQVGCWNSSRTTSCTALEEGGTSTIGIRRSLEVCSCALQLRECGSRWISLNDSMEYFQWPIFTSSATCWSLEPIFDFRYPLI